MFKAGLKSRFAGLTSETTAGVRIFRSFDRHFLSDFIYGATQSIVDV
jgi:hypothetical protein